MGCISLVEWLFMYLISLYVLLSISELLRLVNSKKIVVIIFERVNVYEKDE